MGGFVQGIVLSPLLLLKTRVMTDPSFRGEGGLFATAAASAAVGARIIRAEGAGALMKGSGIFSLKRVVMVEEAMRDAPGAKLSDGQLVLASLTGGALSALSTIPMDVVVAIKQSAAKAGKAVSLVDTFSEQIKAGGVGGTLRFATKGLLARVFHVALTTLAMKTISSKVYDIIYPQKD